MKRRRRRKGGREEEVEEEEEEGGREGEREREREISSCQMVSNKTSASSHKPDCTERTFLLASHNLTKYSDVLARCLLNVTAGYL